MTDKDWEKAADFIMYAKNLLITRELPPASRDRLIMKMDEAIEALEGESGLSLYW